MPVFQIVTNLARSKIPENLGQLVATTLSSTMRNKPVERILVHIATDQLIFAGSNTDPNAPTMYGVLRSIGSVTADDNRQIVQVLTKLLHEQLHIAPIEIRLFFGDFAPEMVAFNGKIVTDILAGK